MRGRILAAWLMAGVIALATGCAAKQPQTVKFSGCVVEKTWTDREGNERKDCICRNGKVVGFDARARANIIRCSP